MERKKQLDMLHGPIWNKIPQFALPVAATAILEQLFNASDIAVVGNFTGAGRTIAVAAVGANSPLIGLIVNLFIGIALGTNVVIAHAIGHGNKEDVGAVRERCFFALQKESLFWLLLYHDVFGAWRAMEELFTEGRARAIGVDNFTQDHLADFLFWNRVKPAVNLLECNPFFQREDERTYLKTQEIQMQAWSPLSAGQNDLFHNEILCKIGVAHGKSAAQVVLRWLTQRGIVPLVKSSNSQRMKENLDIFDFTLSENEMQQIATLDTGHTCFAPRNTGASVTAFLEQAVAG